ncbi:MAG: DUF2191 domain-containing protein [Puniceicoccaceae bacterium]|nr:MAG: DUF2191 domain-containing protein [Puniceicoccaceae bacterium]
MRTTVSIEDGLLEHAKRVSQATGKTLGEVIEDALRIALVSRPKHSTAAPIPPLKTFRGTGTLPGVDLNSSSGILDMMEGR